MAKILIKDNLRDEESEKELENLSKDGIKENMVLNVDFIHPENFYINVIAPNGRPCLISKSICHLIEP